MVKAFLEVFVLLGCLVFCCHSKPTGGIFKESIYSVNTSNEAKVNGSCFVMGLYNGGTIAVWGIVNTSDSKGIPKNKPVNIVIGVKVFRMKCANFLALSGTSDTCGCDDLVLQSKYLTLHTQATLNMNFDGNNGDFEFVPGELIRVPVPPVTATTDATLPTDVSVATDALPNTSSRRRRQTMANSTSDHKHGEPFMSIGNETSYDEGDMYLVQVSMISTWPSSEKFSIVANVTVKMHNFYGYLSAVDYPALVFFGIMTTVYAIFGLLWIILMMCSFKDLVRLQFWVLAVIILGFLEKTFFVAEYSAINLGNETCGSFFVAEFVSAVKRGLSRMLLIIVALGFGTVKPRLGDSLFKVVTVGVVYFSFALVDGIMRARADTFHTNDTSSVITMAILIITDTIILYWIFSAIVETRRTLRLRKNFAKLAMYNHFAYALIFAVLATVAFTVWIFVALEYPPGFCLTDWREVWVRDCFWHVLFAFILMVVMVIWRPSSNRNRFAYSLVNDEEEVVFEQGSNKNFDTVKMRSINKSKAPPVSSQAEDDLRWVEENLPTTAMDKVLELLDSEEEVMTTKFEVSKMN